MRKLQDITSAVLKYHPEADLNVIFEAYLYSAKAHRGQSRRSGAAYFTHPVEVAYNLTLLRMDEKTIAAGLLHDTLEDTLATPEEIKQLFGEEVYQLVEGVTKIGQVEFASKEEKQAENYRKMILAMARDIRVVLIKLADRAHNIKSLESLTPEQQARIARETLDVYSPLANRLGMGWLKAELESGAFKYIHPDAYKDIAGRVEGGEAERKKYVEDLSTRIANELKSANIPGSVAGRPKHLYSIYKKMHDQGIAFEDVYDLLGIRVITDSVKNCYAFLGLIHSLWKPIPGKFKDYIAMPKPNMYQSLHTTVIGPEGKRVEVQIRTEEMHRISEEGIAAHWQYKEGGGQPKQIGEQLLWVRHLIESQKDLKNPKEFLNAFKVDLFPQEVYVFTPQGDVIALPAGASPVDFAYQVHSDIGNHCHSAKVNGRIVPLRYKLRNGDRIEIATSKQKNPSRDWLSFIKTSKARGKIASYLNNEEKTESLRLGQELFEQEIRRYDMDPHHALKGKAMHEIVHSCGYTSADSLFRAVGLGKVPIQQVLEKLVPPDKIAQKRQKEEVRIQLKKKAPPASPVSGSVVRVKCFDDNILLRMGKCCNPVPGDNIVGYITRGRGVSVHHVDCPSVSSLLEESERIVEVEWSSVAKATHSTRITIVTEDKPGLLAKISAAVAACDVNITKANIEQGPYKRAYFDMSVEIRDLNHLNRMVDEVMKVPGVIFAERIKETKKKAFGKIKSQKDDENPDFHEDRSMLIN
jgi:GTP pyrophosphokinase